MAIFKNWQKIFKIIFQIKKFLLKKAPTYKKENNITLSKIKQIEKIVLNNRQHLYLKYLQFRLNLK
jgi:hypothetical protein